MGAFNINITGVGGHGCERGAAAGEKLHRRCGRFTCPDCLAYEFTQRLRQTGMLRDGEIAYSVEVSADDPALLAYLASGRVPEPAPEYFKAADGKFYRQKKHQALFTHWPESPSEVVDDMLKNERRSGRF